MKKFFALITSIGIVGAIGLDGYYLFTQNSKQVQGTTTVESQSQGASTSSSSPSSTSAASEASSSSTYSTSSNGEYKDGTYSGSTVSTRWGNVQVQVKISGGKISDVSFLKSTSEDGESRSQEIDAQAEPIYISEAKQANSANIQAVSGATVTYNGYTESLQAALDQAV